MLEIDEATEHNATAARLRYLVEGQELRISDLADELGGYACEVVEVEGRMIWVDLPIRRDGMLNLAVGQLVSVRFDRPGDAVYTFDSVVADVRDDDRAPFALAMPVTISRRAHRNDARISMVLDATFEPSDDIGHDGRSRHEGKVVDLSAGGLGLICKDEMPLGGHLTVHCDVPGPDGSLAIEQVVVIRSKSMYGRTPAGTTLHHYGVEFEDDDDGLREQILSSVIWNLTRNPGVL